MQQTTNCRTSLFLWFVFVGGGSCCFCLFLCCCLVIVVAILLLSCCCCGCCCCCCRFVVLLLLFFFVVVGLLFFLFHLLCCRCCCCGRCCLLFLLLSLLLFGNSLFKTPFLQLQSFILIACFVPDCCGCFSVVVVAVVLFSGVLWLLLLVSCRLAVVVVVLMFVGVPSLFLDVVCFASLGSCCSIIVFGCLLLFWYCCCFPVFLVVVVVVVARRPFCNSVCFPSFFYISFLASCHPFLDNVDDEVKPSISWVESLEKGEKKEHFVVPLVVVCLLFLVVFLLFVGRFAVLWFCCFVLVVWATTWTE